MLIVSISGDWIGVRDGEGEKISSGPFVTLNISDALNPMDFLSTLAS